MTYITGTTTATDGHIQVAQALYAHLVTTLGWTVSVPWAVGVQKSKVYPINSSGSLYPDAIPIIDEESSSLALRADNQEGAFEMGFYEPVNLTAFYNPRADGVNFDVQYFDGNVWVQVYSGTNSSSVPQSQKHEWATTAVSDKWRIHWMDLPSHFQSGGPETSVYYANGWVFYKGADHLGYVPHRTVSYELHATGIPGYTRPYIQFYLIEEAVAGYFNLAYRVGVNVNGTPSNFSPYRAVRMTNVTPVTYWIAAGDWSCTIATKTGGVYDSGHFGLLTPYSPSQFYPFPGVCGGTPNDIELPGTSEVGVRPWFDPDTNGGTTLSVCNPYGSWLAGNNKESNWGSSTYARVNPYFSYVNKFGVTRLKQAPDGTVSLLPIVVMNEDPSGPNVFGEFEGTLFTPGLEAHSETIATVGGVDYMILQFAHETTPSRFFAMRLT